MSLETPFTHSDACIQSNGGNFQRVLWTLSRVPCSVAIRSECHIASDYEQSVFCDVMHCNLVQVYRGFGASTAANISAED
jgi:hypothetical protein